MGWPWTACKSHDQPSSVSQWKPPVDGWIKIDVDASFIEESGPASAGIIIRDYAGNVIISTWRLLFHCTSAEEAELQACREGLRLGLEWSQLPAIRSGD
ncbi:hypothetical protein EJB05_21682, partial [Eragrostis curvula]